MNPEWVGEGSVTFSELALCTRHGNCLTATRFVRWFSRGTSAAPQWLRSVSYVASTHVCVQRDHPVRYAVFVRDMRNCSSHVGGIDLSRDGCTSQLHQRNWPSRRTGRRPTSDRSRRVGRYRCAVGLAVRRGASRQLAELLLPRKHPLQRGLEAVPAVRCNFMS
jgi:hypothetical protein